MSLENAVLVDYEDLMAEVEEAGERQMQLAQLLKNCSPSIFEDYDREKAVDTCEGIAMQFTKSKGYLTVQATEEGYFYIYENYKITFLNDYKLVGKTPELKFYKDKIKNNLETIESKKNDPYISASMKKALEEKQKDFCYYSIEDQTININDFFIKSFLKVEKTNDYINFNDFKNELEKFLNVKYINSYQLKKFLKFYNIDYNKKFMS